MSNNSIQDSNTDEGRFAISLLAKKRLEEALPEEVLIDHETGEILSKDSNGKAISFPYSLRVNISYDKFLKTMRDNFIYGLMREINPNDSKKLPYRINEEENLLDASLNLTTKLERGILIQLDIDVIENFNIVKDNANNKIKYNDIRKNTNLANVEVAFSISYKNSEATNVTSSKTWSGNINKLNTNIFNPQYFTDYLTTFTDLSVTLDSIKVSRLTEDSNKNLTMILYNVLFATF